jgi:predicted ATPase
VKLRSSDLPQANELEKLRLVVDAVRQGAGTTREVGEETGISPRHVNYYLSAGRVLGFLARGSRLGGLRLTTAGLSLAKTTRRSTHEHEIFISAVQDSAVVKAVASKLLSERGPSAAEITERIVHLGGLSATTAARRASCLMSWRQQLVKSHDVQLTLLVDNDKIGEGTMEPEVEEAAHGVAREFRGQVRDSHIRDLLAKARKGAYGKYLVRVSLPSARGFVDQEVAFDFPVTALIGPNGGGKSTVLGAAACLYQSIKPRQFFGKSGKLDRSMRDWRIEYEAIDRDVNARGALKRTASFKSEKWSRDALARDVLVFGVSRTVPATERVELRKCATASFAVDPGLTEKLSVDVATAVGRILGKDVKAFNHIKIDKRGRVSLLSGRTRSGVGYSEFHFGAGESSVIRMIMKIESSKENCLILIEEIENGLHPVATIRMVEYLIEMARRKSAQAIFTTHSNDALKPLPYEAVWATVDQKVFQGKLDIHALRAISGQVDSQLVVFVEDEFAGRWIETALRRKKAEALEAVQIHAMHGDGTAVQVNRHHNLDPSRSAPSICFVDGDSRHPADPKAQVMKLPGGSPESHIYDAVLAAINKEAGRLALALHQTFDSQAHVRAVVEDVRRLNVDPHLLYSQVGERLGFLSEEIVRSAFLSMWTQLNPDDADAIVAPILKRIKL